MELKDTVELMNSNDYKDRFLAEYLQVKIRYDKLCDKLRGIYGQYEEDELEDELDEEDRKAYELLHAQASYMKCYIDILKIRAEKEGVDLKERQ